MKSSFVQKSFEFIQRPVNLLLNALIAGFVFLFATTQGIQTLNEATIYATLIAVISALIALLPISYGFYLNNLESEQTSKFDLFLIKQLQKDAYFEMMFVILFAVITIAVKVLFLLSPVPVLFSLISVILGLVAIQYVTVFNIRLFDPDRVLKVLSAMDKTSSHDLVRKVSLDQFIQRYLDLETEIKNYISLHQETKLIESLPLYDIVDQFSSEFPMIQEDYDSLKEIIYHRNNIIHNYHKTKIDPVKFDALNLLTERYKKATNRFIEDELYANVTVPKNLVIKTCEDFLQDERRLHDFTFHGYNELLSTLLDTYFTNELVRIQHDFDKDLDYLVQLDNYSKQSLIGIAMHHTSEKNFDALAKRVFGTSTKTRYVFAINLSTDKSKFTMMYLTKDKQVRIETIT
jgi:hypothetical protein